ncbi:hypothetical protein EN794_000040 [Mesorhizobium sp. M00.F.Ca.ET.151.01.1.1]|nr:hypothetical protein EN794_000040 [Mesorhizobium sp. M00.F.Ca.ET.151.01.1.1]
MSIEVMTKVIHRAPVRGSELTCMLIMANWCNDDGDSLYPSIALLAEAMRVSRSQAQRVLHELMPASPEDEAAGNWWFRVVGNEKGGAPGMTRRYEMNVARLDTMPKLPEFEKADLRRQTRMTGRTGATGRMDATGSACATPRVAPVRPDSSEQPSHIDLFTQAKPPRAASVQTELMKVLDVAHAAAVIEHRKRLGKPLTAYAARLLATELAKAPDVNAAADMMILRGWQGFKVKWLQERHKGGAAIQSKPQTLGDWATRIIQGGGDVIDHQH